MKLKNESEYKFLEKDNFLDSRQDYINHYLISKKIERKDYTGHSSNIHPKAKIVAENISAALKKKIVWDWNLGSGSVRGLTYNGAAEGKKITYIHFDNFDFVALIYLSRPEDCYGGTAFYEHKTTGLNGVYSPSEIEASMNKLQITNPNDLVKLFQGDQQTEEAWTRTSYSEMKSNRLIVFNGRMFHSHFISDCPPELRGVPRYVLAFYGNEKK